MVKNLKNQAGFLMISLILAICIIAILFMVYYFKPGSGGQSTLQTGKKALDQTRVNNASQLQEQMDVQNQINSINQ